MTGSLIRLGRPTHLKVGPPTDRWLKYGQDRVSWTACGLIGTPSHGAAYDPREVDCENCRRTRAYRQRLKSVDQT